MVNKSTNIWSARSIVAPKQWQINIFNSFWTLTFSTLKRFGTHLKVIQLTMVFLNALLVNSRCQSYSPCCQPRYAPPCFSAPWWPVPARLASVCWLSSVHLYLTTTSSSGGAASSPEWGHIHVSLWPHFNSMAPGRFQFNLRKVIFKLTLVNGGWGISYEIALRWMPQDLTDDKSTLVQLMAWCRQATSHYLSQCWLRCMSPNGVTRPQWVNTEPSSPTFTIGNMFTRAVASAEFTSTSASACHMCEYEYEYKSLIITWVRVPVPVLVDE